MIVETTPTTPEDVAEFFPRGILWRIKALTVRIDGAIKGIGGYAVLPEGDKLAFIEIDEAVARQHPVTLQKAVRRFFAEVRDAGIARMVCAADPDRGAAPRWLKRMGFVCVDPTNGLYEWRNARM